MKIIKITLMLLISMKLFCVNVNALGISAETAVLIEASSGKILFSRECEKRMKPASTTKILTAITALENSSLNEVVEFSDNAASTEGSSIYAEAGEKYFMEDLISGLLMNSGNDASVAIAEHISGDIKKFAALMNKKAYECGAINSNFVNPSGLDDENHYTTAYDLALISAAAMENENFRNAVKTKTAVITTTDGKKKYLKNHNRLLSEYKDCDGVKTGFTKASGRTLVSSAKRNDMRLIAVTMNAHDDWNDHKKMLDYGFLEYEICVPLILNEKCFTSFVSCGTKSYVSMVPEKTVKYVTKQNDSNPYEVEYFTEKLTAPVKKGDTLGYAVVRFKDGKTEKVNLLAAENIEKIIVKKTYREIVSMFFQLFLKNHIL